MPVVDATFLARASLILELTIALTFSAIALGMVMQWRRAQVRSLFIMWLALLVAIGAGLAGTFPFAMTPQLARPATAAIVGAALAVWMCSGWWVVEVVTQAHTIRTGLALWPLGAAVTLCAACAVALDVLASRQFPQAANPMDVWLLPWYVVCVAMLVVFVARSWRMHRHARQRLQPMLIGFGVAMLSATSDLIFRWPIAAGWSAPRLHIAWSVNVAVGLVVLGVCTMWAIIEIEREHLTQSAQQVQDMSLVDLRQERLHSLGTMASGVAHDMNNVLTAVRSSVDSLREEVPDTQGALHVELDAADRAAVQGAQLAKRLLRYARQSPTIADTTMPASVLSELLPMLTRVLHRGVSLQSSLRSTAPVDISPTGLEQLTLNLVLNARDAMPNGGSIHIELDQCVLHSRHQGHCGVVGPGQVVRLIVRDGGHGIPAVLMPALCTPFVSNKGALGTGLGLASVASVVQEAGGALDIQSHVGIGSTFTVWLPVSTNHAASDT